MARFSPTPALRGTAVLIEYPAAMSNARSVHAAIAATVSRAGTGHATMEQLVMAIAETVAEFGYRAVVAGRTRDAMQISVTFQ